MGGRLRHAYVRVCQTTRFFTFFPSLWSPMTIGTLGEARKKQHGMDNPITLIGSSGVRRLIGSGRCCRVKFPGISSACHAAIDQRQLCESATTRGSDAKAESASLDRLPRPREVGLRVSARFVREAHPQAFVAKLQALCSPLPEACPPRGLHLAIPWMPTWVSPQRLIFQTNDQAS